MLGMSSDLKTGKRARTRVTLIATALALFQERGIQRTSLDEVAARAGVTKGSVYSSFRNKDELVVAVMETQSVELQPALRPGMSDAELYRAIGEAVVGMMPAAHARGALLAEFHLYAVTHEALRPWLSTAYAEAFERLAAEVAALGLDRPRPTRSQMLTIQALILGLVQQRALTPDLVTDENIVAVFEGLASA